MRVGVPHGPLAELPQLDGLMAPHQLVRSRWRCRRVSHLDSLLAWGGSPVAAGLKLWLKAWLPLWRCEWLSPLLGSTAEEPVFSCSQAGIYYDATRPSQLDGVLPQRLSEQQCLRATAVQQQWRQNKLSK